VAPVAKTAPAPRETEAKAKASASAATAPATVTTDMGSRASPGGVGHFDGMWNVHIDCPKHTDGTFAFTIELVAQVRDGVLRGERGTEGTPNWFRLLGVIEPDGNAKLDAKGLTGDPKFSVGGVGQGTPYAWSSTARFEGSRGTGRRTQLRTCDLTFVKQ
jgi:hypothetical protein